MRYFVILCLFLGFIAGPVFGDPDLCTDKIEKEFHLGARFKMDVESVLNKGLADFVVCHELKELLWKETIRAFGPDYWHSLHPALRRPLFGNLIGLVHLQALHPKNDIENRSKPGEIVFQTLKSSLFEDSIFEEGLKVSCSAAFMEAFKLESLFSSWVTLLNVLNRPTCGAFIVSFKSTLLDWAQLNFAEWIALPQVTKRGLLASIAMLRSLYDDKKEIAKQIVAQYDSFNGHLDAPVRLASGNQTKKTSATVTGSTSPASSSISSSVIIIMARIMLCTLSILFIFVALFLALRTFNIIPPID